MPAGRPTSYAPEFAAQAEKLGRLGATDAELAHFFEVDERTINRWKGDHPEFRQSLKAGKLEADATVADRLYRRACGYEHEVHKVLSDGRVVSFVERLPPDTTACIFWLKNRRADLWRDAHKQEHEVTTRGVAELSPEERAARAVALLDEAFGKVANQISGK